MANLRARELRSNATVPERRLWRYLWVRKTSGQKFRRQVPIDRFIVDFACLSHRLIIEIDGATHSTDDEVVRDARPQKYLESQDFMVLRFSNVDVMTNTDGVMDTVVGALAERAILGAPTPAPFPQGGGE